MSSTQFFAIIFDFVKEKLCCSNWIQSFQYAAHWNRHKMCFKCLWFSIGKNNNFNSIQKKETYFATLWQRKRINFMKNFIWNKFARKKRRKEQIEFILCVIRAQQQMFGESFVGGGKYSLLWLDGWDQSKTDKKKANPINHQKWKQSTNGNCHQYLFK